MLCQGWGGRAYEKIQSIPRYKTDNPEGNGQVPLFLQDREGRGWRIKMPYKCAIRRFSPSGEKSQMRPEDPRNGDSFPYQRRVKQPAREEGIPRHKGSWMLHPR